ncbi:MAG TPA: DNA methyltransferase [Ignavibacteriaceae bacterium]|nr:DNA methyltransferase [Ignavibacteriaceae bacterium]
MSEFLNIDCMEGMKTFPDKHFDLAIVDPPYGEGQHFNFRYGIGNSVYKNIKPSQKYFDGLFRISKNQIIWGGNYFTSMLYENRCWISWYKGQPINSFSDFELAWTSFNQTSKAVKIESYGFNHADFRQNKSRPIHPTQKPIALYKWLLKNYAKEGDLILDTHVGSASSLIACEDMGFNYVGYELDKDYYDAAQKRLTQYRSQLKLAI